eukprot:scaffold72289_cov36-Tisochrysis_lutea.AAC.1
MRVKAPRAAEPMEPRRRSAADRRRARWVAKLASIQADLSSSCREKRKDDALAAWSRAVCALTALLREETELSVLEGSRASQEGNMGASIDAGPSVESSGPTPFVLVQQALQSGPLSASRPARFRRLARDGMRNCDPVPRACGELLAALRGFVYSTGSITTARQSETDVSSTHLLDGFLDTATLGVSDIASDYPANIDEDSVRQEASSSMEDRSHLSRRMFGSMTMKQVNTLMTWTSDFDATFSGSNHI